MSIVQDKSQRRILPRWRTSASAAQSADLMSIKPTRVNVTDNGTHMLEARYAFEKNPSIGSAADLIAAALMANEAAAAERAAAFVLAHGETAPQTLLTLARSLLGNVPAERGGAPVVGTRANGTVIAHTRMLLRLHPDNPVLWSDMARHYASHGDRREAHRCMRVALQLAPNHRWLLRIAARFLVHSGEPLEAHRMLAQHPRTAKDPWLIAAELATAQVAQRTPKFWRQANDFLKANSVPPLHLSELATAVGMLELEGGEAKKARKLVDMGLRDPTENTLAQISWARQNKHLRGASNLDDLVRQTSNAFEADFRLRELTGDLLGARAAGERWAYDEPFAARPMAGLAFIASVFDDYAGAVELARKVRHIDGHVDLTLEMNTLCAKMSSGVLSPDKDQREIDAIHARIITSAEQSNAYHAVANLALWHYRYGKPETGSLLYQNAIAMIEKIGSLDAAAMAASYAAREAILAQQPGAQGVLEQAKALAKRSRYPIAEFYIRKLDDLFLAPDNAAEILSPNTVARYLVASEPKPAAAVRLIKGPKGLIAVAPPRKPDSGSEMR